MCIRDSLVTNHLPTNGKDTRRILNEAHQVIYFPHSASGRIKYLLIDYLGLDKKIRHAVSNIMNKVLEIGRHFKTTALVTNHLPTSGKDTRRILNEAHQVIYFPHSASGRIKYLLIEYLGLNKKMVQYFRKQNSRWGCIFENYPVVYMLEHKIGLLNHLDDDP